MSAFPSSPAVSPFAVSRALATGLIAGGIILGTVGVGSFTPLANAESNATMSRHCSESGDSCAALYLRNGKIVAEYLPAERYRPRARICVKPPNTKKICRTRPYTASRMKFGYAARFSVKAHPGVWRLPSGWGPIIRLRVPA